MTAALSLSDLGKAFGGNTVLHSVDLEVKAGELVALLGPNGAGKTTLLNLVTGIYRPDTGLVRFGANDVTRRAPSDPARRRVLRTYQDGGTFAKLSARDNVAIAALTRGVRRGRAMRDASGALERLGLSAVAGMRAEHLSGGQRKLVDLGRTMVVDSDLVLLDEPTAGVNPTLFGLIADEIRRQQESGCAFLVISHDLPWVFDLCPRIVVLAAGRVLRDGTPTEVENDPKVIEAYLA